jgi:NH3-dependent NAD+ synthetase
VRLWHCRKHLTDFECRPSIHRHAKVVRTRRDLGDSLSAPCSPDLCRLYTQTTGRDGGSDIFQDGNVRPVLVYRVRSLISCARATRLIPPATVDAQRHGPSLGQGEPVYDITFENVQAGLRTDYLFRLANHHGRIVIGTGDLSELALGWCTYGVGDQMAHYNVNSGVPKTLIQHLIRWGISSGQFSDDVSQTLRAIPAAEISPELVPVEEGQSPQSTEAAIGPYALQDFNLYYTLRFGFRPSQVAFLAMHAWDVDAKGDWPSGVPADQRHHYDLGD